MRQRQRRGLRRDGASPELTQRQLHAIHLSIAGTVSASGSALESPLELL